MRRVII